MRLASALASERAWAARECLRRVARHSGTSCDTALVSFPRSGSHLARATIEFHFLQPTLGDGDSTQRYLPRNLADRPILERLGLGGRYESRAPILVKRHQPPSRSEFPRQVFLIRTCSQAVLSHLRDIPDSVLSEQDVRDATAQWGQVVRAANKNDGDTLVVSYEDLVGGVSDKYLLNFVAGSATAQSNIGPGERSDMVADQARLLLDATRTTARASQPIDLDSRRTLLEGALNQPAMLDLRESLNPQLHRFFV